MKRFAYTIFCCVSLQFFVVSASLPTPVAQMKAVAIMTTAPENIIIITDIPLTSIMMLTVTVSPIVPMILMTKPGETAAGPAHRVT